MCISLYKYIKHSYISCYPKYSQYREENKKYIEETGTEFIFCKAGQNKEPFKQMSTDNISMALKAILEKRKHPILIHCLEGDFGTACVIGCLRKLQNWSLTNVYSEYQAYCTKINDLDLQFITLFQPTCTFERKYLPDWIDQLRRPILYYISDEDDIPDENDLLEPDNSD